MYLIHTMYMLCVCVCCVGSNGACCCCASVGGTTSVCGSCAGAEELPNCCTCVCCRGLAVDTVADSTPAPDIEPLHVPASPSPSAGTEAAGPDELSPLENGSLSSAWTSKYSTIS